MNSQMSQPIAPTSALPPQQQTTIPPTPITQLISVATSLEADLRNVCVEARRKYPELQESAERALVKLRTIGQQQQIPTTPNAAKSPLEILQSESILRPFLLACATKTPKLTTLALAATQKLISLTPVSPRFLATIMGTLRIQAESEDQQVQLKILQTLLLTISPAAVESGELLQGSLLQALSICFRLFLQKKSMTIHHTAFAALRQVVTLLFDRVSWQSQHGTIWQQSNTTSSTSSTTSSGTTEPAATNSNPSSSTSTGLLPSPLDQLSYEAQNAYLLFQDLCILSASGSSVSMDMGPSASGLANPFKPRWLTNLSAPIPSEVCIELLENILASNPTLFLSQPAFFTGLIKSQLAPLLIRMLRSHFEFGIVLRLLRLIFVVVKHFHLLLREEVEIFLSLFIRMLNLEFPLWHRVLVLEVLLQLFHGKGEKFAYWLFQTYDITPTPTTTSSATSTAVTPVINPNQTKIFTSFIHALSKLIIQTGTNISEGNLSNGSISGLTLSGGGTGLGVGSTGLSSTSGLITQSSSQPVVTLTLPTSPSANTNSTILQFSGTGAAKSTSEGMNGLSWRLYTSKGNRGLDLLNLDQEVTSNLGVASPSSPASSTLYEESYVVTLGIECLVTIVNGFATLAKTNEKWGGANEPTSTITNGTNESSDATSIDLATLRAMCNTGCMPLLGALSFLLNKTEEESNIQYLLMSYQSFTNTCGVLELTKSRDLFLHNLAGFALPKNGLPRDDPPSELIKQLFGSGNLSQLLANPDHRIEFLNNLNKILLSPKNIQSLKALFNISHCLGRFLGSSSWLTILETFQTLDTMIQVATELNFRLSRDQSLNEMYQTFLPHQTEISIMAAALSRLFESTRYLDDQAVIHVLSALGTLSLSSLANAATSEGLDQSSRVNQPTNSLTSTASHPSTAMMTQPQTGLISSLNLNLHPPTTIRMFALQNLIATIEHNMFRITTARLWEIGIGHLTCVINHKDGIIRQYGVVALTKITILALSKSTTYQQLAPPPVAPIGNEAAAVLPNGVKKLSHSTSVSSSAKSIAALAAMTPVDFQSAIQSSLLEPFSDLFRSKYEDTRENILMSLYQILQNSGQYLIRGGWKVILGILQSVVGVGANKEADASVTSDSPSHANPLAPVPTLPTSSATASASFINVGFNSIQLITNDYLESIPFSSLSALIQTIAAYCSQTSDTNISFTSIGLLWRVSDYMGKIVGNKSVKGATTTATVPTDTDPTTDPANRVSSTPSPFLPDTVLTDQLADELMYLVFTSLVHLCTDTRTEVRNSAVKTLHNTLVAHATRMSFETCVSNLSTLVLPLLGQLLTQHIEDSPQHTALNSTELGKDKTTGKSVMMLIHYSRDTASKQWDETRVYALQGTARVIKSYTENFIRVVSAASQTARQQELIDMFQPVWVQYIEWNAIALANRSPEVTLSALNSVVDLLLLLFASSTSATTITSNSSTFIQQLWRPILDKFYLKGIIHAVVQEKHLEWVEEKEREIERERKARKLTGGNASNTTAPSPTIDFSASPYPTQLGDMSSDDGWKNWIKTYTHMIGHFQTLLTQAKRIFETPTNEHDSNGRDDLTIMISLSYVLVVVHSTYTDRKSNEIFHARKLSAATTGGEVIQPDRKETPIQAAHIKLLESLTVKEQSTGNNTAPILVPSNMVLSSTIWSTIFQQLLSSVLSDYGSTEMTVLEHQLQSLLLGETSPIRPTSTHVVAPPPMYSSGAPSPSHHPPRPLSIDRPRSLPPTSTTFSFHSSSFSKKVLRVFARSFGSAPPSIRAAHFAHILPIFERVITGAVEQLQRNSEVAEEAVASFIHILEAGLDAVNQQMVQLGTSTNVQLIEAEKSKSAAIWSTIIQIFASFLAPASASTSQSDLTRPVFLPSHPSFSPRQHRLWENLQIAFVGCLLRIVFPQIKYAEPSATQVAQQLIRCLNIGFEANEDELTTDAHTDITPTGVSGEEGVQLATSKNELLSHSCLMALFQLVRSGGVTADTLYSDHLLIASLCGPLLLHRCSDILLNYLELERIHSVNFPLPRCRREEMGFILKELSTLEMHPIVANNLTQAILTAKDANSQTSRTVGPFLANPTKLQSLVGSTSKRGHLLILFPLLCQCITMRESELRELLRDCMTACAIELGLANNQG